MGLTLSQNIFLAHTHAHTHGEYAHNLPPSSQKDGVSIENSPLKPPGTHPRVFSEIPFDSTQAQSLTPAFDSKLSEAGAVSPTSKASPVLITASSKGRSSIFDKDWSDFVDRDHSSHSKITRAQVDYTIVSMHQRAL